MRGQIKKFFISLCVQHSEFFGHAGFYERLDSASDLHQGFRHNLIY
jgi:hypothetical protein